ncbi:MAG: sterol desaturase family protein [Steroidobacteraceae bacterium]|jgi:sterol desaturase/sphingolipid hydroxylase (fatty acid hydroxylase superfamily)
MVLSKATYYADFFLYPPVLVALAATGLARADWYAASIWFAGAIAGFVFWTFLEYLLHRVALHYMPYFSPMHGVHHAAPLAYVGTPTWISFVVWGTCVFAPAWYLGDPVIATGLTFGVMAGYFWYGLVHHLIHHRRNSPSGTYFNGLRTWHMRHHYWPARGNFGVTTSLWDRVFRTVIRPSDAKPG